MPQAVIDLFTDQDVQDPVFDQIHACTPDFFRPKMEAMMRSRFDRTVLLDADTVAVCDFSEIFQILDHCEFAAAEGISRETKMLGDGQIPRVFPLLNAGVIAFQRSARIHRFAAEWLRRMIERDSPLDQPILRELLYEKWVDFGTLPYEYNVMTLEMIDFYKPMQGAPRLLHCRALHQRDPGQPEQAIELAEILPHHRLDWLNELLACDPQLSAGEKPARLPPYMRQQRELRRLRQQNADQAG